MFECELYEPVKHTSAPASPTRPYEPVTNIEAMSFLVWSEHCGECAAPECYSTCDLYEPRPDRRCRRFSYGMYRNSSFASFRGYGIEIQFKKWGRLAARGNARMFRAGTVKRAEALAGRLTYPANAVGGAIDVLTKDIRWSYGYQALLERAQRWLRKRTLQSVPDGFLLEIYNPSSDSVSIQIGFGVAAHERAAFLARREAPPVYQTTVVLPPGYMRHTIDYSALAALLESGCDFDIGIAPVGDSPAHLVLLSADLVKYRGARAPVPPQSASQGAAGIKCVVWDLDGTLWRGVLVETDDVQLNESVVDLLQWLDERGILVSIASKNDHEAAWKKLTELGVAEYFLYPQIGWQPKSQSIRQIAASLNLGLDTFAVIDDNEFELDEIRNGCPAVSTINARNMLSIQEHPRFQGSATEESRNRRKMYQQAMVRDTVQAQFGSDIISFLRTCDIRVVVAPYSPECAQRAGELVQRTNQLNFSGRKYSREQLSEIVADATLDKYVLSCADRFGDYGMIGFAIVKLGAERLEVHDLMISCRVQGKFIEQAFLSHIIQTRIGAPVPVWVNFRRTTRNTPAFLVLEALGFRAAAGEQAGEPESGMWLPSSEQLACDFIRVTETATCAAAGHAG